MKNLRSNKQKYNENYLKLAFELAKINLGKTKTNPSVGCVIVKNTSVISSGHTSINGRPHAEYNALKNNLNYKGSDLYVTMEPCVHLGLTPPCTDIIKRKGVKRVFFSVSDIDTRTANKSFSVLRQKKIKVTKKKIKNLSDFYKSYFINKNLSLPFIDAKIALSKDNYSVNRKKKWITNLSSRIRTHLIRSNYDSIISTSKTINTDNAQLNCRLKGFDSNKPDLIIIDMKLKIKRNLKIFNFRSKRKIFVITSVFKDKKLLFLKKKGVKIIYINSLQEKHDFINLFKILKKNGFNRILVESGLVFLSQLLKKKVISNLFLFKSTDRLGKNGFNKMPIIWNKRLKSLYKIKVNLNGDQLYKIRLK